MNEGKIDYSNKTLTRQIFLYPVDAKNSTVLGYGALSQAGKPMWESLYWPGARKDGGMHFFNPQGGDYLHVRVKPLKDGCVYRVRCRHYMGKRWRGGVVTNVQVTNSKGKWLWLVTVTREKEEHPLTSN